MDVINIATRVLVVLVGIAIFFGFPPVYGLGSPFQEVFGLVVILFGALRLVMYLTKRKRRDDEE